MFVHLFACSVGLWFVCLVGLLAVGLFYVRLVRRLLVCLCSSVYVWLFVGLAFLCGLFVCLRACLLVASFALSCLHVCLFACVC